MHHSSHWGEPFWEKGMESSGDGGQMYRYRIAIYGIERASGAARSPFVGYDMGYQGSEKARVI